MERRPFAPPVRQRRLRCGARPLAVLGSCIARETRTTSTAAPAARLGGLSGHLACCFQLSGRRHMGGAPPQLSSSWAAASASLKGGGTSPPRSPRSPRSLLLLALLACCRFCLHFRLRSAFACRGAIRGVLRFSLHLRLRLGLAWLGFAWLRLACLLRVAVLVASPLLPNTATRDWALDIAACALAKSQTRRPGFAVWTGGPRSIRQASFEELRQVTQVDVLLHLINLSSNWWNKLRQPCWS